LCSKLDIQTTSMGFMSCLIEYTFLSFKRERLLVV